MNMLKECTKGAQTKFRSVAKSFGPFFFLHESDDEFHVMIAKTCIS